MRTLAIAALSLLFLGTEANAPAWGQTAYTTSYRYDVAGRLLGTIAPDPDGPGGNDLPAVRNSYDASGNLSKIETGSLLAWQAETVAPASWANFTVYQVVDYVYDSDGRLIRETKSGGGTIYAVTQYSYDNYDRKTCMAVRMNPANFASPPSDPCVPGAQGNYGGDRITRTSYDNRNRTVKIERAVGTALQQDYANYTYNAVGGLTSVQDANGNLATMTYDGFNRQIRWNFPSKTVAGQTSGTDYEAYGLDANGNRLSLRKRNGCTINYTYDALNRVTVKDLPSGGVCGSAPDVYYGYDLRGLQAYARFLSDTGVGITNHYDGFGRLLDTTNNMGSTPQTLAYRYDADSNRTRITHPSGLYFTYDHDELDRLTMIKDSGTTTIVSRSYDAQGALASETRGTVTTAYTHDPLSRLTRLSDDLTGTVNDVTTDLGYSPAGQIVSKTRSNDLYAFGNYANVSRTYTTNGLNQYTAAGPASFTYDDNGNLTGDGTNSYTYDVENRLVAMSGASSVSLQYDPQGRLWRQVAGSSTLELEYDGDHLVASTVNGTPTVFVNGEGQDDPLIWYTSTGLSVHFSLQKDQQGSIVSLVNMGTGALYGINTYDEYGIPGSANVGRLQYTGQLWLPALGMYYYKARMYSPTLGRFMQTDPIGYKDQLNLYAYVGNDPIDGRDPTGTTCKGAGTATRCFIDRIDLQGGPKISKEDKINIQIFNTAYTAAVIKLESHPDQVQAMRIRGKEIDVRAGNVAASLRDREFVAKPNMVQFAAGTSADGKTTSLGSDALAGAVGEDVGNNPAFRDREVTVVHEGIHGGPDERKAYPDPFDPALHGETSTHSETYDKVANILLGPE